MGFPRVLVYMGALYLWWLVWVVVFVAPASLLVSYLGGEAGAFFVGASLGGFLCSTVYGVVTGVVDHTA